MPIYKSLLKFTTLAKHSNSLTPEDTKAMIGIHELLTKVTGNNPEIWLEELEAEAMRHLFSDTDRVGTFTGAPAQSTMIRTTRLMVPRKPMKPMNQA